MVTGRKRDMNAATTVRYSLTAEVRRFMIYSFHLVRLDVCILVFECFCFGIVSVREEEFVFTLFFPFFFNILLLQSYNLSNCQMFHNGSTGLQFLPLSSFLSLVHFSFFPPSLSLLSTFRAYSVIKPSSG